MGETNDFMDFGLVCSVQYFQFFWQETKSLECRYWVCCFHFPSCSKRTKAALPLSLVNIQYRWATKSACAIGKAWGHTVSRPDLIFLFLSGAWFARYMGHEIDCSSGIIVYLVYSAYTIFITKQVLGERRSSSSQKRACGSQGTSGVHPRVSYAARTQLSQRHRFF